MQQTRVRLQGRRSIPDRLVSLLDPDARPIRQGKLSHTIEFGYKLGLVEKREGFISHFRLHGSTSSDDSVLVDAVAGYIHAVGATPRAVAADRGMNSRANEAALRAMSIARMALPARGGWACRLFAARRLFRRLPRWRSGRGRAHCASPTSMGNRISQSRDHRLRRFSRTISPLWSA
ncbi:hypothetical protein [Geochorda subterranea]|uniref:DDE family transposase n=1 Tax=Geochorda subterranea TaxID=3109564 RepID=A0ABZ1BPE9_9FIRM|nr:hypothetical protein [Limnochorda sp. LNt]WRP14549.1 hypothetical protein VLY81_14220 [Limnochorda sp. LNt]